MVLASGESAGEKASAVGSVPAAALLAARTVPFVAADPARFNNPDLMTARQARRFAQTLAELGCVVGEVRAALRTFGWDLAVELAVIEGGRA